MNISRRIKRILTWSFLCLYLAGVGYWISHLFLRHNGEFGEEPHVVEKILGPTHLGFALVFIFVMGIVWEKHIRVALKIKKNRWSGWIYVALIGGLACSGITIVYGSEDLMKCAEKIHPWIGVSLLPILAYHAWKKVKA